MLANSSARVASSSAPAIAAARLQSIDALRGLVIVLMLLDHVRETFLLHAQVADPMDVASPPPGLFFSRLLAHLCAPVFVFLTGLSACLYATRYAASRDARGEDGRAAASAFLFKRGLFLVLLEVTLVNFAWTFQFPPTVIYLQVIWAIGLSMLALSALVWLPRTALAVLGLVLVAGHNVLDGVHFPVGEALHVPWAILHDRGWIELGDSLRLRTSYPVLPWIGVIALGYAAGPLFSATVDSAHRQRLLVKAGAALIGAFVVLRALNVYGDSPWHAGETALTTAMSWINITKYPPSLLFVLLTLGLGLLLLAGFERLQRGPSGQLPAWAAWLAVFGGAPMFFYLLHLYVLKLMYLAAVAIWGLNHGKYFGFDGVAAIWLCTLGLALLLYRPVRRFAEFKTRRRDLAWLRYL